jgi:hypothetical protein
VVIEVVDAGVGMAPQAAEHVARVLADPGSPGLDLADVGGSPRLGLAVIGRLAHTVGFQASVRPSAAGGVKAQLSVPRELVLEPASATADRRSSVPAAQTPLGDPRPPGRQGPVASNAAADGYPDTHPGSRPDGRPAGLPQRRRRAPVVEAANGTPTVNARGASQDGGWIEGASAPASTSEPGEWFDAFRGDQPGSPTDQGGAAS